MCDHSPHWEVFYGKIEEETIVEETIPDIPLPALEMDIVAREEVDTRRVTTFHDAEVQALPAIGSDHSPLLLVLHPEQELTVVVLWNIWKSRNNLIFRAKRPQAVNLVDLAQEQQRNFSRWQN